MTGEEFNYLYLTDPTPCECHKCIRDNGMNVGGWPLSSIKMILCEHCGNKRCPHASDHRLQCTESNEPGQAGSVY